MRRLMLFSIGFAASCFLAAVWETGTSVYLAAGILLLAVICLVLENKVELCGVLALLFLGASTALCWFRVYDHLWLQPVRELDGTQWEHSILLTRDSWDTDYGLATDGQLEVEGKSYKVRVYLPDGEPLKSGTVVKGKFYLRLTAEGGVSQPTYHRTDGVFLLAYQRGDVTVCTPEELPAACLPGVWRGKLLEVLRQTLPEDVLGFVKALLLGAREDLSYGVQTDFRVTGISHIVAVSGLHVSILFSLVQLILGKRRYLCAFVGIPVLVLFAAMVGFTPSVTRAALMQGLMMLALVFDREYDRATALSFAGLVILILNPLAILSVSFQLSMGCMIGIFLFSEKLNTWLQEKLFGKPKGKSAWARFCRYLSSGISMTLSSMVVTTPLVAWYFGTVSLVSVVTNLLTLWVVSYIFYGAVILCLVGLFSVPAGSILGLCIAWPVRYVLGTAHLLARMPLAAIYTGSVYTVLWLVLVYALLAAHFLMKDKRPVMLTCCAVICLCVTVLAGWAEPYLYQHRVTVLSVGQGQCVILQSAGRTFVVDCGGDDPQDTADLAAETLLSQGISHIDGLIITHGDADHAGGLQYFLQRIQVDKLFVSDIALDKLPAGGEDVVQVTADTVLRFPIGFIRIFAPENAQSSNDSSLAVLFQTEKCDTLITGDLSAAGELALLRRVTLPDLEILVVGHHGAHSSTTRELLKAVKPETALISVGQGNRYDHPHRDTLRRLEEAGCAIYRTDIHGTITVGR